MEGVTLATLPSGAIVLAQTRVGAAAASEKGADPLRPDHPGAPESTKGSALMGPPGSEPWRAGPLPLGNSATWHTLDMSTDAKGTGGLKVGKYPFCRLAACVVLLDAHGRRVPIARQTYILASLIFRVETNARASKARIKNDES